SRFILIILFQIALANVSAQQGKITQLSSPELSEVLVNNKATLIDVRTRGEYANGHITGAGQLNYYALVFKKKLLLLLKDRPLYLYCNTGYRSQKAAEILAKNGYTNVYNLEHGIMEWDLYDMPVVVEPDAKPDTENKMEPDEFYALIQSEKPVLIDFYAPWCGPCRQMMPVIDRIKQEAGDRVFIVKINADASKKLVKELQLLGVPYITIYHKGLKTYENQGLMSEKELLSLVEANFN
ncbi:MAG TPA: hypothetical protein ENN61_01535, partial [Bacteroidaceae bacterium]|nr:hypothetical protein [Bacteroidaceae bacterium]